MSTIKQTKLKINDVAKDLGITGQALSDFLKEKLDVAKKPAASLTPEEMNVVLEHFSQNNQVDSFNEYFAMRNLPRTEKKPEKKTVKKPAAKNEEKNEGKNVKPVSEKPSKTEKSAEIKAETIQSGKPETESATKTETAEKREKQTAKPEVIKPESKKEEKQDKQNNHSKPAAQQTHVQQSKQNENKKERFNTQQVLGGDKKKKPEQKQSKQPAEQSNKKKLDVKFADSSAVVDQKIHKIDTRGSYVEMDKYNEKYDNMANVTGGGSRKKDNFSKKQKLTQKSQQRKNQQYSNKRETEAEKLRRLELERARKQQLKVLIPDEIVVSELASRLKVTATEVIKKLMQLGEMCTINQVIDFDTASLVAEELGAKVEKEVIVTIEERLINDNDDDGEGVERAPVVVVMGHVDHGKTSLLDKIRNANVTSTEAGGITQHIGAYRVTCKGKEITFLDTPGHEAFTSMRARGASVTDIAILVVAADDGIMPQTVEAINHAKAAGVSIIVAINKMDKEGANPDAVKQKLTEYNLVVEEWGGDVICVPVSAKTGEGIDELLENVLLVAEVAELKANPNRLAKGAVIEARLDKGRGPIATLLVQNGTLRTGDIIIAGTAVGRVRVMTNDNGKVVKEAGPSYPVEITGLAEVPSAGDTFNAVEDERLARELVEQRKHEAKQEQFKQYQKVTLDNLFSQIEQGEIKELPIIVKADVQGSVEAVKQSLEKLSNEEVRVKVIHGAVGAVSEGDVMLANASNAIIVGFNVRPDPVAADSAERDGVDIRLYRIIYDAIEEITTAMKGMLAPKFREVNLGRVEVRQVYKISNVGMVSGSYVLSGKITRNAEIRVVRDGIIVADDKMSSLKRFKDDVKEVAEGYECGITLEKFSDVHVGDIFEAYYMEEYRPD